MAATSSTSYRDVNGELAHTIGFTEGVAFALRLAKEAGSHDRALRALEHAEGTSFGVLSAGRFDQTGALREIERRSLDPRAIVRTPRYPQGPKGGRHAR